MFRLLSAILTSPWISTSTTCPHHITLITYFRKLLRGKQRGENPCNSGKYLSFLFLQRFCAIIVMRLHREFPWSWLQLIRIRFLTRTKSSSGKWRKQEMQRRQQTNHQADLVLFFQVIPCSFLFRRDRCQCAQFVHVGQKLPISPSHGHRTGPQTPKAGRFCL